jgi:hypothetical protein
MLSVVLHHRRAVGGVEEKWTSQLRLMCFYLYNISVVYIVDGLVKEKKKKGRPDISKRIRYPSALYS